MIATAEQTRTELPLDLLVPSADNPRAAITPASLAGLVESIRAQGIVQALTVRPLPGDSSRYEIIAGHRRYAAAQLAGLASVPVHIVEADDRRTEAMRIVENLQRANLDPVEEATALVRMRSQYEMTDAEIGALIGKSGSWVGRTRCLLELPPSVLDALRARRLSAGVGWALQKYRHLPRLAERLAALAEQFGLPAKAIDTPFPHAVQPAREGLIIELATAPPGFDLAQCNACPFKARFVDPTDDGPGYCAKPQHFRQLVVEARRAQHDAGAPLPRNAVQPVQEPGPGRATGRKGRAGTVLVTHLRGVALQLERLSAAEARDPHLLQLARQVRAALDRVLPAPAHEEE